METLTLTQLQSELSLVNSQIEKIMQNKQVTRLKVGSATFSRDYIFTGTTLQECLDYRNWLFEQMRLLSEAVPKFATNMTIPNSIHKQIHWR